MELKPWLARCPLVAILRGVRPTEVEDIGAALHDSGLAVIEVPLNSPDPFRSIEVLARRFGGDVLIGAGTVMTTAHVAQLADAGGRLMVTPHADVTVTRAAKAAGLLTLPGFFTPTEAFSLLSTGADGIKLFPAEAASPAVLKALLAILPQGTAVLPVGGIDAATIPAWRAAGAAGFGAGSSIYRPGDSAGEVAAKARRLLAALADAAWT